MRKEFARFFGDKRLVITTIILPGLLIYVLYSFMGTGMNSMFKPSEGKLAIRLCPYKEVAQRKLVGKIFSHGGGKRPSSALILRKSKGGKLLKRAIFLIREVFVGKSPKRNEKTEDNRARAYYLYNIVFFLHSSEPKVQKRIV